MMRAGSRIMSPPGCLAPSNNAEKHGIYDVFGTSTHSRLGPRSEPSRAPPGASCKEPCQNGAGSAARALAV